MSTEEPTELVSQQVAIGTPLETESQVTEQAAPGRAISTSNQEAMVAQILKRTKNQVKALETLVKRVDNISRTIAELDRTQSKKLREVTGELKRLQASLRRVQPQKKINRRATKKKATKTKRTRRA